ncbi:hypothetical protein RND71_041823 [Anisodus tanguticus]|uniref:Uncharacterized protein n=1 Tax=Anisodus tanguticus TaxID=243964 RepID=A0AAE1UUR0_9SOLA|nr:hypothetical protein RND71_041823 [Anisodus tanguticus]
MAFDESILSLLQIRFGKESLALDLIENYTLFASILKKIYLYTNEYDVGLGNIKTNCSGVHK